MPPVNLELQPDPLSLPLPRFRHPISDPDLPEVTVDPEPTTAPSPGPTSDRPGPTSPEASPAPPPVLSPERPGLTRTSSAGDPKIAAQVIAGLVALGCGIAFGLFGRRGLHFRQPTERQVDEFSTPLGSLLARHLPTELISKDLVEVTAAAGAAHRYVIDGPLIVRYAEPIPEDLS